MSLQVEGNLENINNYLYMLNKINNRLIEIESNRLEITQMNILKKQIQIGGYMELIYYIIILVIV